MLLPEAFAFADTVRVATFNVSLGRRGPGVLLKDIMTGDEQVLAVAEIIRTVRPDILLLNEFDVDFADLALKEFRNLLVVGEQSIDYPYFYAPIGNEGHPSGLDLDGDGETGEWADAFGFGRFPGSEGMALLSLYPIDIPAARTFSNLKWRDLPGSRLPLAHDGRAYLSDAAALAFRVSSKSHWDVPVILPNGRRMHILASHPTPPVFDGPENLNGLRNDAEIKFWVSYLDGAEFVDDAGSSEQFGQQGFVLLGDMNNDPNDGEGIKSGIQALLAHRLITDPLPASTGAKIAATRDGGENASHVGNPVLDTVSWDADIGNMRVDYALPSASLTVISSGVFWPMPNDVHGHMIKEGREGASNHRLVWVDVEID